MGFKDAPWDQRLGVMGDEAEQVFEDTFTAGFARYGLRRPPIRVDWLPPRIRFTPDYVTSKQLVEVMGVGKDQKLKIKVNKLSVLGQWNDDMQTDLFVWDSHKRRHFTIPYMNLIAQVTELGELGTFPEGTAYWGVDVNALVVDWDSRS